MCKGFFLLKTGVISAREWCPGELYSVFLSKLIEKRNVSITRLVTMEIWKFRSKMYQSIHIIKQSTTELILLKSEDVSFCFVLFLLLFFFSVWTDNTFTYWTNHSHTKRNNLYTRTVFTEFLEYVNNSGVVLYWGDRPFSRSSRLVKALKKFFHF